MKLKITVKEEFVRYATFTLDSPDGESTLPTQQNAKWLMEGEAPDIDYDYTPSYTIEHIEKIKNES